MVNTTFVSQSASDIHKKLQKLEGFAGMNISQLIEIANKVYNKRGSSRKRGPEKGRKDSCWWAVRRCHMVLD